MYDTELVTREERARILDYMKQRWYQGSISERLFMVYAKLIQSL